MYNYFDEMIRWASSASHLVNTVIESVKAVLSYTDSETFLQFTDFLVGLPVVGVFFSLALSAIILDFIRGR